MSKNNDRQVKRVVDAWLIKGTHPQYHDAMKKQLYQKWPKLAVALDMLANNYDWPQPEPKMEKLGLWKDEEKSDGNRI